MNVRHIVPSLEEQHGGPSKSVRALCEALARLGHATSLYTTVPQHPGADIPNTNARLTIRTFLRGWPDRICRSTALAQALESASADVVHHHSIWLRTLHYAHRSAKRKGARLVVSPRGMMSDWAWRHHRWRKRFAMQVIHPGVFQDVSGWHVTSAEEENDIRSLGFEQPICIAPNGVDLPSSESMNEARAFWHEAVPDAKTRRVALFYSRFHPKKRVLELIDLWLQHAPADWLLLLVGIPQEYTPESLEQYVLNMSAVGRVRAFSGLGKPAPYAIASLFLLPSHSENFGLAIAEAMAHGVPVLVTDTTPWSQLTQQGCGWCVPWSEYAPALCSAFQETSAQLQARGERAREWVLRDYSWDRSAAQLADFYADLMATHG